MPGRDPLQLPAAAALAAAACIAWYGDDFFHTFPRGSWAGGD